MFKKKDIKQLVNELMKEVNKAIEHAKNCEDKRKQFLNGRKVEELSEQDNEELSGYLFACIEVQNELYPFYKMVVDCYDISSKNAPLIEQAAKLLGLEFE